MVTLTNEEEAIVETLVDCLAHAVAETDGVSPSQFNKTVIQKFIFMGIQKFDLSVTYSWYLAGSLVESDTVSQTTLDTASEDLPTPSEPSIDTAADDPDQEAARSLADDESGLEDAPADIKREFEMEQEFDPHIESGEADRLEEFDDETFDVDQTVREDDLPTHPDIPIEDCIDYFTEELDRYPLYPTDRFLQQFYSFYAPDGLETLYIHSLYVRSDLRALVEATRTIVHGETPETDLKQIETDLNRHLSRVHLELADDSRLQSTLDTVLRGTDLIEDAIMMLSKYPQSSMSEAHLEILKRLQTFYFEYVWKHPALKISAQTATGPSAGRIRRSRTNTFETFDEQLTERCEVIRKELDEVGLLPSYEDYPDLERTSVNEAIVDFTNAYTDE